MFSVVLRLLLAVVFVSNLVLASAFTPSRRSIDVSHYLIKMEIDPSQDPKTFQAALEMKLKATSEIQEVTLDTDELDVKFVQMEHPLRQPLKFTNQNGKEVKIELPRPFKANENFRLSFSYVGKVNTAHAGFFKVTDPDDESAGPFLYTHFEPLKARAFFPSNDTPEDKASSEMRVTVPSRYEVLSNGKKIKDRKFSREGKPMREVHWMMDKPHSTYLVSLAIAPLKKIATKHGGKEISVWVGQSKLKKAEYCLGVTKKAMGFFEKYLGVAYPWPQYATVGLPTFLWGGMENTSSTHMNQERTVLNDPNSEFEKKRIVGLAAHELAHQWFGDYVTMQWWDDLWLNEAFASHMGTLATKHIFKNEEAELEMVVDTWEDYFRQEDGPRSHPIVDKELTSPDDAFDSISYTKGENVLRMLSFYLGEPVFQKGLTLYLTSHKLANATHEDFFHAMEKASKKDLQAFRNTWLLQRGYPVVSYGGSWDAVTGNYVLTLKQRSNHASDRALFHFKLPLVFHRRSAPSYRKETALVMESSEQALNMKLPAPPEWVTVNPNGIVLAKVRQETRQEDTLAKQALYDDNAIARVWANYELAEGLLEGKSLSPLAETTLIEVLNHDPSSYVRNAVLAFFGRAKSRWLPKPLAETLVKLAQHTQTAAFENSSFFKADPHGARQFHANVLGALGKVDLPEVLPLLAAALGKNSLGLDELGKAAHAVAALGNERSVDVLKTALSLHQERGYRYRYHIQYAFGALESPKAVAEIRELAKTCGADLIGRMGWVIRDNQTLKNSKEWAQFLRDFVISDTRFGDEVKARILQTVEDVKNDSVRRTLRAISEESSSDRLKEVSRKILEKNFQG